MRKITFDLYLGNHRLDAIFDELYQPAFTSIGQGWCRGEVEVYEERQAVEIALAVLRELRELQPPPMTEFTALGGTPGRRSLSAAHQDGRTRRSAQTGWRATSLGTWLPVSTMIKAACTHRPDMVWLSCSHVPDESRYRNAIRRAVRGVGQARRIPLVLGGQRSHPNCGAV